MNEPLVDIIVPVYGEHDAVRRCARSILKAPQKTSFELIFVDDAGPDKRLSLFLKGMAQEDTRVTYLRNDCSRGFAGSVNRAMGVHPDRDLVLLKSDTEVANDWLDRLANCAYSEDQIGTVSPFTNNGSIFAFPESCEANELPLGLTLQEIDAAFSRVNRGEYVEVPTSVGFCMYIKRACAVETGVFKEERLGKGYGEETDFCLRAGKKGWRHVLCGDVFIYHQGGASLESSVLNGRKAAFGEVTRAHPSYKRHVCNHLSGDPTCSLSIAARLELVRASKKMRVLFISHHLGGGCEQHIAELGEYFKDSLDILTARPSRKGGLKLHFGIRREGVGLRFGLPGDYDDFLRLCRYLAISRIHFHHLMAIHPIVRNLPRDLDIPYDVTLHDYYLLNGNPTLTDRRGRFLEDPILWARDGASEGTMKKGILSAKMREMNGRFLLGADRVIAPSTYTSRLYRSYFPGLSTVVAYHPDWEKHGHYPDVDRAPLMSDESLRIAVLGALNREKGADLLESAARMAKRMKPPLSFHLIGYAYRSLDKAVTVHGPYEEEALKQKIRDLNPHIVWFPSLCPETYSYTLSCALELGKPVVATDIGAFPERLANRPLTWVRRWTTHPEEWVEFFHALRSSFFLATETSPLSWDDQPKTSWKYRRNYAIDTRAAKEISDTFRPSRQWIRRFVDQDIFTAKEKMLLWLLRIRFHPRTDKLARVVPYHVERRIKRWFSKRPIHEIME